MSAREESIIEMLTLSQRLNELTVKMQVKRAQYTSKHTFVGVKKMSVKAKFRCDSILKEETAQTVRFSAVTSNEPGSENAAWSKWTPSGQLMMNITNPAAFNQFVEGKEYFLTLEEAPQA